MSVFLNFLYSQIFVSLPEPTEKFTGKTIIVTGANVGLGFEAARHFTKLDAAKVILACRSAEKGAAAKKDIEESTGRTGVVEVWQLDLQSSDSVKAFAKRINDELPRLDAIVENAGINTTDFKLAEGHESTIKTNVTSTFLLALLVLPKLRETAKKFNVKPHLIIVASEVHYFTSFPERKSEKELFEVLNSKETARMGDRYNVSKLLEVFYIRELAKRVSPQEAPIIACLNPGLCHSSLSRDGPFALEVLKFFIARSTEAGSRTLVSATSVGPEAHGAYLSDCKITPPSTLVQTEPQTQKMVWDAVNKQLEAIQPGIMANL